MKIAEKTLPKRHLRKNIDRIVKGANFHAESCKVARHFEFLRVHVLMCAIAWKLYGATNSQSANLALHKKSSIKVFSSATCATLVGQFYYEIHRCFSNAHMCHTSSKFRCRCSGYIPLFSYLTNWKLFFVRKIFFLCVSIIFFIVLFETFLI